MPPAGCRSSLCTVSPKKRLKGPRQRRFRRIKLMADYTAFPLWGIPDEGRWGGGMLSPGSVPISDELVERLWSWAAIYDRLPEANFQWPSQAALTAFVDEGRRLCTLLRQELGPEYTVVYFDEATHRLEDPTNLLPAQRSQRTKPRIRKSRNSK